MKLTEHVIFLLVGCCLSLVRGWAVDDRADPSLYNIGVGIADCTGPSAGVNMMGYANPAQISNGIHTRLFSRAFIFDDTARRVVFISVDVAMVGQLIKIKVVERLQELYGSTYSFENVIISATHTHSGPAGFLQNLLFDVTCLGFIQETFDAMVDGIVESVVKAHSNVVPGYIYMSSGELLDASINRSPTAYDNNPEEERIQYQYNTDKLMTVLKFVEESGEELGMLSWYGVHLTSMNNTNKLISGDNKGVASQMFEDFMNDGDLPGQGSFVAAFAQGYSGDVSPNTRGATCQDTGLPCDIETSTCGGSVALCIAQGPGDNMMESTKIIGELQFNKAMELYNSPDATLLSGPVQVSQQLINMANYSVTLGTGEEVKTCTPALGYSFAAGTTDGPGAFSFSQGMMESNPFWNTIIQYIRPTSPISQDCHSPKPILLDTGNYNWPYSWHPKVMDTQIAKVGNLFIAAVPGEFTTMSGRRLQNVITNYALSNGITDATTVIAGLSNGYSHYITTFEEYQIQRYEGASTIFGPHTLEAYLQQYNYLMDMMDLDTSPPLIEQPEDLTGDLLSLLPAVFMDQPETGYGFGEVIAEPYPVAYTGETVIAKFASGHPRNNLQRGGTFLTVEKLNNDSSWDIIATDAHWETRFVWEPIARVLGTSEATIYWDVPEDAEEGIYRMRHYGAAKALFTGAITNYKGTTNQFKIIKNTSTKTKRRRQRFQRRAGFNNVRPFNWLRRLFGIF